MPTNSLTDISEEPRVAKNAIDIVSRINPKYHFPSGLEKLERQARICLGLPFEGSHGGLVAYGYIYTKDTDTYTPIPELFKLLWEGRRYLYTSSLREVADWINFKATKLGLSQKISHMGLRNLMILRPPFEECLLPVTEREKILESLVKWNHKTIQ